jgi:hypothetical protein
MLARGLKLSDKESTLYKAYLKRREMVAYWKAEETKALDALLGRLYPRLDQAVSRIASLLNVSKYEVRKHTRRLKTVGKL